MEHTYIVQKGIWSPREGMRVWRSVAEFENSRRAAERCATGYPAARILRADMIHEHTEDKRVNGPHGHTCGCGHTWSDHIRTASGAWSCRYHGCGCRDVVRP
jgi:ribosomal protein L37AE/L43A